MELAVAVLVDIRIETATFEDDTVIQADTEIFFPGPVQAGARGGKVEIDTLVTRQIAVVELGVGEVRKHQEPQIGLA